VADAGGARVSERKAFAMCDYIDPTTGENVAVNLHGTLDSDSGSFHGTITIPRLAPHYPLVINVWHIAEMDKPVIEPPPPPG
jgi:hypothetical protein